MKTLLAVAALMLMTGFAHAKNVEETILKVESKKDAKCTYVKTSPDVCLGYPSEGAGICYRTVKYKCLPNDVTKKPFRVKLKVKQVGVQEARVTKIKYKYKK